MIIFLQKSAATATLSSGTNALNPSLPKFDFYLFPPDEYKMTSIKTQTPVDQPTQKERKRFTPLSYREYCTELNQLTKKLEKAKEDMWKVNKDHLPENFELPDKKKIDQLLEHLESTKSLYKDLSTKTKHSSSNSFGLRTPQYMSKDMTDFVSKHSDFPEELVPDRHKDLSVFDRITLTKFFMYYVQKNKLKDSDRPSMIKVNDEMSRLFERKTASGDSYFDMMKKRIRELKYEAAKKKRKNVNTSACAQYEETTDGKVKAFNHAALQTLFIPFFENGYQIPGQKEYCDKLKQISDYYDSKTKAKEVEKKKPKKGKVEKDDD